jgi:hypothetical protein
VDTRLTAVCVRACARATCSYGTLLEHPVYDGRDASVSRRHLIGLSAVPSFERPWLTAATDAMSTYNAVIRDDEGNEMLPVRQIAGRVARSSKESFRLARGRYYVPGAVPARAVWNIAQSVQRRARLQGARARAGAAAGATGATAASGSGSASGRAAAAPDVAAVAPPDSFVSTDAKNQRIAQLLQVCV